MRMASCRASIRLPFPTSPREARYALPLPMCRTRWREPRHRFPPSVACNEIRDEPEKGTSSLRSRAHSWKRCNQTRNEPPFQDGNRQPAKIGLERIAIPRRSDAVFRRPPRRRAAIFIQALRRRAFQIISPPHPQPSRTAATWPHRLRSDSICGEPCRCRPVRPPPDRRFCVRIEGFDQTTGRRSCPE
jgi:hypothetical protein